MTLSQYTLSAYHHSLSEFPDAFAEEASIINVDLHFQLFVYIFNLKKAFSPHSNFLSFFKRLIMEMWALLGPVVPLCHPPFTEGHFRMWKPLAFFITGAVLADI